MSQNLINEETFFKENFETLQVNMNALTTGDGSPNNVVGAAKRGPSTMAQVPMENGQMHLTLN
jgi:hypothetical protein